MNCFYQPITDTNIADLYGKMQIIYETIQKDFILYDHKYKFFISVCEGRPIAVFKIKKFKAFKK